jgi:ABC-type sugar transport system ATPase subunit
MRQNKLNRAGKNQAEPVLQLDGIVKNYPGVKAVRNGRFELLPGEVHCLIGENGAGKSTLIKILSGAVRPDAGRILINGKEAKIRTPQEAFALGVSVIYQEFNLVPALTAEENIFLGKEKCRSVFVSRKTEYSEARKLLKDVGFNISPNSKCSGLTVAEQQAVEIAKSLAADAKIIAMDEPTSALTPMEVEKLFRVIESLRKKAIGIIYITHRLEEVFEISDRVTVMRDGEWIGTFRTKDITRKKLIELMVGRPIEKEYPARKAKIGSDLLEIREIQGKWSSCPVSFSVRTGEVLGITGLVGSGKTSVARLIFGADQAASGAIYLGGWKLNISSPIDAIDAGISFLTENRKEEGLVLGMTARENFSLPNLRKKMSGRFFINREEESKRFEAHRKNLRIKTVGPNQIVRTLSGGTQQKIVLAKWLESESRVIIFDEPTRGIDVGARYEIYSLINDLAARGKAAVLISSDFSEILGMSDRIIVMSEGAVSGEIGNVRKITPKDLMALSISAKIKNRQNKFEGPAI